MSLKRYGLDNILSDLCIEGLYRNWKPLSLIRNDSFSLYFSNTHTHTLILFFLLWMLKTRTKTHKQTKVYRFYGSERGPVKAENQNVIVYNTNSTQQHNIRNALHLNIQNQNVCIAVPFFVPNKYILLHPSILLVAATVPTANTNKVK